MNKNVLLIYGESGVGKTSIMKGFIDEEMQRFEKPFVHYIKNKICIFGEYHADTVFLGTDKLSMSIQPIAIDFILNNKDMQFIVEGERMFNEKFINLVNPNILIIEASKKDIEYRRVKRGALQSESILKSRSTRIKNIKTNYDHFYLLNKENCNLEELRHSILLLLNNDFSKVTKRGKIVNNLF